MRMKSSLGLGPAVGLALVLGVGTASAQQSARAMPGGSQTGASQTGASQTGASQTGASHAGASHAVSPRATVPRAIRRDIPLSTGFRAALAAGTRDSSGHPGPKYWQLWTAYTINARLDPATAILTGYERIVIYNPSDSTLSLLALRLDQNIFAPNGLRTRTVEEIAGGLTLTDVTANGRSLLSSWLNEGATRVQLSLPTPIAPHDSGALELGWHFRVPQGSLRMGRLGDSLFQLAQWYPRVAVYDDLRGWDPEPYLGFAEFYNNLGHFDVRLDVPAGWLVGATGVLQNPEAVLTPATRTRLAAALAADSGGTVVGPGAAHQATAVGDSAGRLVWHFVADSVTDFAWAASDRYVWTAARAAVPGRDSIPLHILQLPSNAERAPPAVRIGRHALGFYSRLWLPYVFPQLTMVDGPETGMEYPMLVMSDVGAEDHEIGHQWWPMMVLTDETRYGFMDEGFNQYMNLLSNADTGHTVPKLEGRGQAYGRVSGSESEAPMMANANQQTGQAYAVQVYLKAPQMLAMLGGIVGDSAVWRAMRSYAEA